MTATSEDVASIAAKGMTKALTRAEQRAVCASALNQHEAEADRGKLARAYKAMGREIQQPPIPPASQERLLKNLERLGAILFPAKS